MKRYCVSSIRAFLAMAVISFAATVAEAQSASHEQSDGFHVYAPSRTTETLLVVKATPSADGLQLELTESVKLGAPMATIVSHPKLPLIYVTPGRSAGETTPGAIVTLNADGSYQKHARQSFHHGYSYLSLDRANRYLLGVNYFDGFVDVYALGPDGLPGRRVTALNEGRRNAHCVLPSPDNRFVYIPYVKETNAIFQYGFDAGAGTLSAMSPKNANPPEGTGPRHMAYHPKKPIAYFSNEQHLGVSAYEIKKSGVLELRQVCNAVDKNEPKAGVSSSDLVITPDGRYLFAGIRGHKRDLDKISRYRVLKSGDVELLGLTDADKIPWGLTLSPDGKFLLATAFKGATLTAFRIGDDGSLKKKASLKWDPNISDVVAR